MTPTQKKFEELKPLYEAEYLRANGKPIQVNYSKGKIMVKGQIIGNYFKSLKQFEQALNNLKSYPNASIPL